MCILSFADSALLPQDRRRPRRLRHGGSLRPRGARRRAPQPHLPTAAHHGVHQVVPARERRQVVRDRGGGRGPRAAEDGPGAGGAHAVSRLGLQRRHVPLQPRAPGRPPAAGQDRAGGRDQRGRGAPGAAAGLGLRHRDEPGVVLRGRPPAGQGPHGGGVRAARRRGAGVRDAAGRFPQREMDRRAGADERRGAELEPEEVPALHTGRRGVGGFPGRAKGRRGGGGEARGAGGDGGDEVGAGHPRREGRHRRGEAVRGERQAHGRQPGGVWALAGRRGQGGHRGGAGGPGGDTGGLRRRVPARAVPDGGGRPERSHQARGRTTAPGRGGGRGRAEGGVPHGQQVGAGGRVLTGGAGGLRDPGVGDDGERAGGAGGAARGGGWDVCAVADGGGARHDRAGDQAVGREHGGRGSDEGDDPAGGGRGGGVGGARLGVPVPRGAAGQHADDGRADWGRDASRDRGGGGRRERRVGVRG
ncbi:hypothetical protein CSUB01_06115 [Colletotrichum sublineola]|uniref:Uncharacterized protein n=1 Tax=Colletotrichum sublineola TaxID=1173701 RepID=A0A066XBC4_COLSU|nr:hypothetical protein CSUB01_06115 [Colletotrichum sublineola]